MENSSKKLYDIIENLLKEKVVLAFSGGVDSALLLKIATSLRKDENDVVAMFFKAPSLQKRTSLMLKTWQKKWE